MNCSKNSRGPILLVILLLSLTCTNPNAESITEGTPASVTLTNKSLMAIFAHPDDESTVAPMLARYVREGVKVYLVIATDGRLGVNDFSGLEAGDGLVAIRKEELKCAANALGVELIHLDYHDQLRAGEGYDGHMPHARALIREVHQLITELQPDVLLTFGPDGGSNHMDHRLIGATVSSVFLSKKWGKPASLYYYGTPANLIENDTSRILRGVDPSYMTTEISFGEEDLEAAITSMQCHKSQFRVEGLAERVRARYTTPKVYLRKFVGPSTRSETVF